MRVFMYPQLHEPGAKDFHLFESPYFQQVVNPAEADWFYCPVDLGALVQAQNIPHGDRRGAEIVRSFVRSLPYYPGNEGRHFFHDYSAYHVDWGLKSVLFRAVKSKYDKNPLTISIPHFVDDFHPEVEDFSQLPYDVCFVGRSGACGVRALACHAVANDKSIKSYMRFYDDFFGYIPEGTPRWAARRMEFINGFRMSRLALSPRGVELDAYRTWEAMSAGRVPIWIGDDYELPFRDIVDYSKFMFIFPESDAPVINERIKQILATHSSALLQIRGEEARRVWLAWFRIEAVPKVFAHYLNGY